MRRCKQNDRTMTVMISTLLGIYCFVFFYGFYPYHLHYQEQYQLFLFQPDYLFDKMRMPGGLADWAARFCIQFCYYAWAGALVYSLILVLLQRLTAAVTKRFGGKHSILYPLTLLPSLLYLLLFCDESYLLTGVVALIIVLSALFIYVHIYNRKIRLLLGLCMLPAVWWLAGGSCWILLILMPLSELLLFKQLSAVKLALFTGLLFIAGALPVYAAIQCIQYPVSFLIWKIGLYRIPQVTPAPVFYVWGLLLLLPLLYRLIPDVASRRYFRWIAVTLTIAIFTATSGAIVFRADWEKEQVMGLDYHVRVQQWDKVVQLANKRNPVESMGMSCLNLALGITNQLGEHMFAYDQKDTDGLIPPFTRDFTTSLPTGEIYYHLGMINFAERFAFEAQESIHDFQKSGRCIKRLAETNLINGQYEVADKYLTLLESSLFYRNWAKEARTCLYKEDKINRHPEWGKLRKWRFQKDFLFLPENQEAMLALLHQANPSNRMALEYLLAYPLIEKDLERFYKHYQVGSRLMEYKQIPRHYQEALLYLWSQEYNIYDEKPWAIDPEVIEDIKNYAQIYTADDSYTQTILQREYGNSYWYYLHFKNNQP